MESPGVSLGGAPGCGEAAVAGALTVHVSVVDEGEHALGARGCGAGRFGRGRHGLCGTAGGTVAPGTLDRSYLGDQPRRSGILQ